MAATHDPVPLPDNLAALAAQLAPGALAHDLVSLLVDRDPDEWNDALATRVRALLDAEAAGLRDGSA